MSDLDATLNAYAEAYRRANPTNPRLVLFYQRGWVHIWDRGSCTKARLSDIRERTERLNAPTEAEARAALLKMAREDLEGDTHDR